MSIRVECVDGEWIVEGTSLDKTFLPPDADENTAQFLVQIGTVSFVHHVATGECVAINLGETVEGKHFTAAHIESGFDLVTSPVSVLPR